MLLAFINRNSSTWSDIKTNGRYAYVVTEGGGGMQIISLQDLDNIQLVGTYSGFSAAHNIFIDQDADTAYIPGASSGMPILDISSARNPVQIANYTQDYVHDLFVQDGYAHLAEIYDGRYRLIDVSNLPNTPTRDSVTTPGQFTHNTWANADNTICVTTDESSGGHLAIYDISNKSNIGLLGEYTENAGGIIHNAFIIGDTVHLSYYAEGYVAVDITNPSRPQKLGSYDTYGGSSGGYDGAWGVYAGQPSGAIYISDIGNGLHIMVHSLQIDHDGLDDTVDTAGPYSVVAQMTTNAYGGPAQSADVVYTIDDWQSSNTVAMAPTGNPDEWAGDLPGMPSGTTVQYRIEAADSLGSARLPLVENDAFVFSVGTRSSLYFSDFEQAGDGGWAHGQVKNQDDWQRGEPQGRAGDPSYAFSGNNCWGNDLGPSGFNGFYADDVNNWLESPAIDCSGATGTRVRFKRWLQVEDGNADHARLRVDNTKVWENPPGEDLLDAGWVTFDLDVSAQADGKSSVRFKFVMNSNLSETFGGWNIDDFEVYWVDSNCLPDEHYGSGTAGSGGFTPNLQTVNGPPHLGNPNLMIHGDQILGGAQCFLFVGFGRTSLPYKGVDLLVDITQLYFLFGLTASGPNGQDGVGTIDFPAPIPNNQNAIGLEVDCQVLVIDSAGPQGMAASDGLAWVVCH